MRRVSLMKTMEVSHTRTHDVTEGFRSTSKAFSKESSVTPDGGALLQKN